MCGMTQPYRKNDSAHTDPERKKYAIDEVRRPSKVSGAAPLVMARRTQIKVPADAVPPTTACC
jgi:hypothetical protein